MTSLKAGGPIRVHIVNDPTVSRDMFHIGAKEISHALRDDADLLARVETTVSLGEEGLYEEVPRADIVVAYRYPHREVMAQAPQLKWIHQVGAGVEHLLPLDWLSDDVILTNSRGAHAQKAGEFVACALLMLNNFMPLHATNQRKKKWDQVFSDCIDGKTLVVVGTGNMGMAGAQRAKTLGLRVIGVNRGGTPQPGLDSVYPVAELDEVLPLADFVLLATPLTDATTGLLSDARLELLKPGAGLINLSRAGVVDYDSLVERLSDGRLSGAVLDVFDPEPLPATSPLWTCDNLVITPHVSSDSLDYMERVLEIFAANLRRLVDGQPLENPVVRGQGY